VTHSTAISIEEAASRLSIAPSTVWKYIREKRIKARKLGRRTVIIASELDDYMENLPLRETA
jgi:excisionase family DNA binding protein